MESTLGDYKIIKQIGNGSLGSVFLAEHRFIKKPYVLKILPEELSRDADFIKNFEEEVAKLAALDHPNIVKIHTVSSFDGLYFLVSDYFGDPNGETVNLGQFMASRREKLKEEELISFAKQIASAIDYAHTKKGVIHRSLKLSNVLVSKRKNELEMALSDFGLSKIIGPGKTLFRMFNEVSTALGMVPKVKEEERFSPVPFDGEKFSTLSQSFLQSFAFLAPEQKRSESVTFHVDIYAFGVILYYLITGQFPDGVFTSTNEIASEYTCDWDAVISGCMQQDFLSRPSQILPFLEKTLAKREPFFTQHDLPRVVEIEEKEVAKPIEDLKESLAVANSKNIIERAEMAHASINFMPVIGQSIEEPKGLNGTIEFETAFVEGKDVSEATAAPITPQADEISQQIVMGALLNRDPFVTPYNPEKKETKTIEPIPTEMCIIPGGNFMRGSNEGNRDEMPRHRVFLDPYAIDIHPVTNEQFVRFLEHNGGEKDQDYHDLIRLKDSRITRSGGKLSIEPGYAKHPVVGVTWYGALAYAKWVGKRLPTEAEWEIACQGGNENLIYPTGDIIEKSHANFFSSDTTPVMSYPPNGFTIYDIVGNVYEWCQDWYGYNYYETSALEPYNPKGPAQGVYRVLRGGCWKSLKEDLRTSHRHRNNPGTVNSTYGFRCAADVRRVES